MGQPISVNNAATRREMEQSTKTIENEKTSIFMERAGIWIPILCIVLLCIFCIGKRIKKIRKRNQLFAFGHMTHEMETQTFQEEGNVQFSTIFPPAKPLPTKLGRERRLRVSAVRKEGSSSRSSKSVSTGSEIEIELNNRTRDSGTGTPSASMLSYIEEGGTGRHQLSLQIPRPELGQSDRKKATLKRSSLKV